jgi:hypothetical protein
MGRDPDPEALLKVSICKRIHRSIEPHILDIFRNEDKCDKVIIVLRDK